MVSVVIPTYNVAPYIKRCIDSVLSQSYHDIEIVVVDDASIDHSADIAELYRQQHHGIRIIKHDKNKGLMTTRRDGYMAASGSFIMFLDADDALPPDAVQTLVERQEQTHADMVMGDLLKIYVSGRTERRIGSLHSTVSSSAVLEALIDNRIIHSLCGKLFKATLLREEGLLSFDDVTIAEDACLLYQLADRAQVVASVSAMVYHYYENKASSSLHTYGMREIESSIKAYRTIAHVCQPYTLLRERLGRRLTQAVFALYLEPVPIGQVRALLRKYDMERYGSARYARRYLGATDCWFFVKRFVYARTKKKR